MAEKTSGPAAKTEVAPEASIKPKDETLIDNTPAAVRDGEAALLKADDADGIEQYLEPAGQDELVVLKQDVLEEFVYPGTRRPSFRVAFHKGQVVARSVIAARAAEIRAASADRTKLENYIDSTTLASGTGFAAQQQAPTGTAEVK